ncbi:MAG: hypothetical protein JNM81_08225 [Rhodospirillaceae bacterium]|nr:hypothetical protein [Rhodospirillaceae bacterium]
MTDATPPGAAGTPTPPKADLIWEDELPDTQAWWLSRARSGDLQVFIAVDPMTSSLLCLGRNSIRPDNYDVLAVVRKPLHSDMAVALAVAKDAVAMKVANPLVEVGWSLMAWRFARAGQITLNQGPLIFVSLLLGALLGLAVALFAVSTQLVGWPMLTAGIVIGAASGLPLKFLVDRRFKSVLGPWGRFWVATLSAAAGAVITAGGLLTLFWS